MVAGSGLVALAARAGPAQDPLPEPTLIAEPVFRISLAQWPLHRRLQGRAEPKLDNLDFAKTARAHGERSLVPDVALGKAWKADQSGNLIFRRTARHFNPAVIMAGRISVVEVEEIVDNGSFDPDAVHLPGIYVNRLVLNATPEKRIEKGTIREKTAA